MENLDAIWLREAKITSDESRRRRVVKEHVEKFMKEHITDVLSGMSGTRSVRRGAWACHA
jgi:hypothetical protein